MIDDTHDVALTIQADCTPSDVCRSQSCLPEVQSAPVSATSSASKSKSKVKSSDKILKEHVVESRMLQEKVETLLSKQDTSRDSGVQFGLFFTSMIPCIDDLYQIPMQYVRQSEGVRQQQYHPHPRHPQQQQYHRQLAQQYFLTSHNIISSIQLVSPIHHLSNRPSSLHY